MWQAMHWLPALFASWCVCCEIGIAVIDALRRKDANFFRNAPLTKLMSGSSEIRNWICLAGAAMPLDMVWSSYVPGYRTPALSGTGLTFASFR